MRRSTLPLALGLLTVLVSAYPTEASAQQRPGAGTVRLSLDAQVVGLQAFPDRLTVFTLGVGGRGLGPGFGYAITDMFLIGARTAFGMTYVDPDGVGDNLSGSIALLPYFEVVFGSSGIVPFVGAQVGFGVFFPDGGDPAGSFTAGAYGGLHAFLADNFSLSPFIELNFLFNEARFASVGVPLDDRAGFGMAVGVSLMGWIGDIAGAVGDTTEGGVDTSGTEGGTWDEGGGGGGAQGTGGTTDDSSTEPAAPLPADPESGYE